MASLKDGLNGTSAADLSQVGGSHYKDTEKYQHWNVVIALNWSYLVGNATKYLWRLDKKGDENKSIEDLEKSIHYLQKELEVRKERRASRISLFVESVEEARGQGYVNQDR
jgi:hypothetical protein